MSTGIRLVYITTVAISARFLEGQAALLRALRVSNGYPEPLPDFAAPRELAKLLDPLPAMKAHVHLTWGMVTVRFLFSPNYEVSRRYGARPKNS